MPQDRIPQNDTEFAVWLANFNAVARENNLILKLDERELEKCEDSLTDLNTAIATFTKVQAEARSATTGKTSARATAEGQARDLAGQVRNNKKIPNELKEKLGIATRDTTPTAPVLATPANLVVTGLDSGINQLRWDSKGNRQGTIYVVEARTGESTQWVMVDAVTKTRYEHTGQRPGVSVRYRIRAKRGDKASDYSNEALVYGG